MYLGQHHQKASKQYLIHGLGKIGRNIWDKSFDSKTWRFRNLLTPYLHSKILWNWIVSEAYYDTFTCDATISLNETMRPSWLCTKKIKKFIVLDIGSSRKSFVRPPRSPSQRPLITPFFTPTKKTMRSHGERRRILENRCF